MANKSHYLRKKGGKIEINWVCLIEKCPQNCCCEFPEMLKNYKALNGTEHDDIPLFAKESKWLSKNSHGKKITKIGEMDYIKLTTKRTCPFYEYGKCGIYSHRPQYCRAYPFYLDMATGINIDTNCPGVGKGWTPIGELGYAFDALEKVYKKHLASVKKLKK